MGRAVGMDLPRLEFSSRFQLVDTVVLEQPDSLPIVRVSGLDRAPDGRWVISDPSEAMVKVFSPTGALLRVIGRKGRGPMEFQVPEFAQFGPSNTIHVADNMLQRIAVFDTEGNLLRHVSLRGFMRVTDLAVLHDGTYLLAGFRLGNVKEVLFRMDTTGTLRAAYVPIAEYVPEGESQSPTWQMVRRPSLAVVGTTATVVLSISDSIWSVDLPTGRVRTERVAPPGYLRPYAANPVQVPGIKEVERWTKSFSTTAEVFGADGTLVIPFVRGLLNEGDPTVLAIRDPDGQWHAVEKGPALVWNRGSEWYALHTPGADQVTLAVYRRRA